MELQGARSSYFDRVGTVTLLALANVLVMYISGQQIARAPGWVGRQLGEERGKARGVWLLEWHPRGRKGNRVGTRGKELEHAVSPQGVEAMSRAFIQTCYFGSSVGIFPNHITSQRL